MRAALLLAAAAAAAAEGGLGRFIVMLPHERLRGADATRVEGGMVGVRSVRSVVRDAPTNLGFGPANVSHAYSRVLHGFAARLSSKAVAYFESIGAVVAPDDELRVEALLEGEPDSRHARADERGAPAVPRRAREIHPVRGRALVSDAEATPWGLDRIDQAALPLDGVYAPEQDGAGAHVFVVDSGIFAQHQEFVGRVGDGYDVLTGGSDPEDCHGHGTLVAAIAVGTRYGAAKGATVHAVRAFGCDGSGTTSGVIAALEWVVRHDAPIKIASLSLGIRGVSTTLNAAVANAFTTGVTVVVSASNGGNDACGYSPALSEAAITVGASTRADGVWRLSNYGPCVDLFAPGVEIASAWIGAPDSTRTRTGTSVAAPHAAGVAAQVLSLIHI